MSDILVYVAIALKTTLPDEYYRLFISRAPLIQQQKIAVKHRTHPFERPCSPLVVILHRLLPRTNTAALPQVIQEAGTLPRVQVAVAGAQFMLSEHLIDPRFCTHIGRVLRNYRFFAFFLRIEAYNIKIEHPLLVIKSVNAKRKGLLPLRLVDGWE